MKNTKGHIETFDKILADNPEGIEKLARINRFPLQKKSTIIVKEDSLKDFWQHKSEKEPLKHGGGSGVASFTLKQPSL